MTSVPLELRKHYCEEELRLNRSWAPDIYLGVVEIRGSPKTAAVEGKGPLLDYAVKMIQFPQSARLDAQLTAGTLNIDDMQSLASMLVTKHDVADVKKPDIRESVRRPMLENFDDLIEHHDQAVLHRLKTWTLAELDRLRTSLEYRRDHGYIRECHGDLHLANLVRLPSGISAFDCVEFSAMLRDIDVISDIAFLAMDLVARQRDDLAYEFLNQYLERSGDYSGMKLFDLYFVYHSLIRAKITAIRSDSRSGTDESESDEDELRNYLAVATNCVSRPPPVVVAMHGFSGSGKTWFSNQLMRALPALRIRSDIERKRMHGYGEFDSSHSDTGQGIYTGAASSAVYERLANLTAALVTAGHSSIVDASFLKLAERNRIRELADRLGVRFLMVDTCASSAELTCRLQRRESDASEANVKVLRHQLEFADPLTPAERQTTISINTEAPIDFDSILANIRGVNSAGLVRV